jgi:hypothetical protein
MCRGVNVLIGNRLFEDYALFFEKIDLQTQKTSLLLRSFLNNSAMAVTRLKRKNRKDKTKATQRRQTLKQQNFQPVLKSVDLEKIKEEFKAKAGKKA